MASISTADPAATIPSVRSPLRAPRAQIALSCTLRRRTGSPIAGETLDLGPEGMRVTCQRPLANDEIVEFEIPNLDMRVAGHALVLRQQRAHLYMLRFERLPEPMSRCLHALAVGGRGPTRPDPKAFPPPTRYGPVAET